MTKQQRQQILAFLDAKQAMNLDFSETDPELDLELGNLDWQSINELFFVLRKAVAP